MRVAFIGTASFAVPTLERLFHDGHSVAGVITRPDKPSGRGQKIHLSPVKRRSLDLGLSVFQPLSLKIEASTALFEDLAPEIIVVVAYGRIIPPWLIQFPKYGVVNLHGSLLPRYRGAAPVNWAIANGDTVTGVSTMQIDEGLDTGPVYLCEQTAIGPDENAIELSNRLARVGSRLIARTIVGIRDGTLQPEPQDHALATSAPLLEKHHGFVDWKAPAASIHNKVRAFIPWPCATTRFRGIATKILRSRLTDEAMADVEAGTILLLKNRTAVCCGDSRLIELVTVQPESRKPVSGWDFANGARIETGERFQDMVE